MNELKAETIVPQGSTVTLQMYPKAEADKVIAELKEKYNELAKLHDKAIQACCDADKVIANRDGEIKKLKDSLGKLLKAKTEQIMDEVIQKTLIYGDGFVLVEHAMKLVAETRHHKYKRCLAMAKLCHWKMGVFIYKEEKSNFYHRWHKRWLELAEKFKPNNSTAQQGKG